jgi:mRNA interferase MazF
MKRGERYDVVVQADELLPRSVVLVAPTSRRARPASFRPEIEVEGVSTCVLVEQLGAVHAHRLGDLAGHLTAEELWGVDDALATVLGIRSPPDQRVGGFTGASGRVLGRDRPWPRARFPDVTGDADGVAG